MAQIRNYLQDRWRLELLRHLPFTGCVMACEGYKPKQYQEHLSTSFLVRVESTAVVLEREPQRNVQSCPPSSETHPVSPQPSDLTSGRRVWRTETSVLTAGSCSSRSNPRKDVAATRNALKKYPQQSAVPKKRAFTGTWKVPWNIKGVFARAAHALCLPIG